MKTFFKILFKRKLESVLSVEIPLHVIEKAFQILSIINEGAYFKYFQFV